MNSLLIVDIDKVDKDNSTEDVTYLLVKIVQSIKSDVFGIILDILQLSIISYGHRF